MCLYIGRLRFVSRQDRCSAQKETRRTRGREGGGAPWRVRLPVWAGTGPETASAVAWGPLAAQIEKEKARMAKRERVLQRQRDKKTASAAAIGAGFQTRAQFSGSDMECVSSHDSRLVSSSRFVSLAAALSALPAIT